MFVSSEFLRARQTAEECRAALQNILSFERQAMTEGSSVASGGDEEAEDGAEAEEGGAFSLDEGDIGGYDVSPPVVTRKELRERSFGELDGTILVNYNKVQEYGGQDLIFRSSTFGLDLEILHDFWPPAAVLL